MSGRDSTITVALLFPDLLGTYGDSGNAVILAQRLRWRGFDAEVLTVRSGDPVPAGCQLYVVGGGEDLPQALAGPPARAAGVRSAGAGPLTMAPACWPCAPGSQILGVSFVGPDGVEADGLGLVDCVTRRGRGPRAVGEIVVEPDARAGSAGVERLRESRRCHLGRPGGDRRRPGACGESATATVRGPTGCGPGASSGPTCTGRSSPATRLWPTAPGWVVGDLAPLDDSEQLALRAERLAAAADRTRAGRAAVAPRVSAATGSTGAAGHGGPAARLMTSTALLTDRYELTMLDAALQAGTAAEPAVFEVFTRGLPPGRTLRRLRRGGRLLDALESFRFGPDELEWLAGERRGHAPPPWTGWRSSRSPGDVHAYPEGELYTDGSPVLTVEAPFGQAVLLETIVLSILNHDSAVAAAASLIARGGRRASGDRDGQPAHRLRGRGGGGPGRLPGRASRRPPTWRPAAATGSRPRGRWPTRSCCRSGTSGRPSRPRSPPSGPTPPSWWTPTTPRMASAGRWPRPAPGWPPSASIPATWEPSPAGPGSSWTSSAPPGARVDRDRRSRRPGHPGPRGGPGRRVRRRHRQWSPGSARPRPAWSTSWSPSAGGRSPSSHPARRRTAAASGPGGSPAGPRRWSAWRPASAPGGGRPLQSLVVSGGNALGGGPSLEESRAWHQRVLGGVAARASP